MAKKYILILAIIIVVIGIGLIASRGQRKISEMETMDDLLSQTDENLNEASQAIDNLNNIDETEDSLTNLEKALELGPEEILPPALPIDVSGLESLLSAADKTANDVNKSINDFDAIDEKEDSSLTF